MSPLAEKPKRGISLTLLVAGGFVTQAFGFEVTQTGVPLPPMQQPAERQVGDRWVQLKNGADTIETRLVSETYATHIFGNTDDCTVTRRKGTRFTPYVSWICPSGSGTNTVTKNGNPWPLEVGKEWGYDVNGKAGDGAQWSYELECEVDDTAIVAPGGAQHLPGLVQPQVGDPDDLHVPQFG